MSANPLGIHAGVWGFDWSPKAAERAISSAAHAGYDLIEIPAIDRVTHEASITRALLEKYKMNATVSIALDFGSDINSTNPQSSSQGEYRLMEAVAFASEIGASFVGGVIYSAMGRYERVPHSGARDNSLAVLRRVAQAAHHSGIVLGCEYVNRYESNLLNTAKATLQFLDDLAVENAVVHLDTFHAHIEETDLVDAVKLLGDRLGYIHASESHRGLLGTGSIDWSGLLEGLVASGYSGPITVETFSSDIISSTQAIDIGLWAPMWSDPDEVASLSIAFLRHHLSAANTASVLAASTINP